MNYLHNAWSFMYFVYMFKFQYWRHEHFCPQGSKIDKIQKFPVVALNDDTCIKYNVNNQSLISVCLSKTWKENVKKNVSGLVVTHRSTALNDLDLCSALKITMKKPFRLFFDCDWVLHLILKSDNNNNKNSDDDFIRIKWVTENVSSICITSVSSEVHATEEIQIRFF